MPADRERKAKAVIIFDKNENSSYLLQNEIHDQIDDDIRVYVEIGSVPIRRVEMFSESTDQTWCSAAA